MLLVNEDQGIRFEEPIEFGQPNDLKLISKVFKQSAVRVIVKPNSVRNATVWRGDFKLGSAGVNLSLFPGKHDLEIRADALVEPFPFTVEFADGAKNLEWPVDVTPNLKR